MLIFLHRLLEFTRCSDSRNSSLPEAIERKEIKYDELLADIRLNNPHLKVELLTFAVGYLGSIIEDDFHAHLTSLGVPEQAHQAIVKATITATASAFGKMCRERWAAKGELARTKRAGALTSATVGRATGG